ncbi:MAG: HAD-IB family hydrolase [Bacteroidota bacterium]
MYSIIPVALITLESPDVNSCIAFFDLDRTIIKAVSGNVLALEAYKKGLMSTMDILHALWLLAGYKLSMRDPQELIYIMAAWAKGVPEKTMNDLSFEISRKTLIPAIFAQAVTEIKMHAANHARTVILSSTPVSVCRIMAESLEMDDLICSELEVKDGYLTGRSVRPLCFGEEKAVRIREYCEINNTDPGNCWYYGDSLADFPALSIVGHPVCVNPDRKLLRKARENRWPIYFWKLKE